MQFTYSQSPTTTVIVLVTQVVGTENGLMGRYDGKIWFGGVVGYRTRLTSDLISREVSGSNPG